MYKYYFVYLIVTKKEENRTRCIYIYFHFESYETYESTHQIHQKIYRYFILPNGLSIIFIVISAQNKTTAENVKHTELFFFFYKKNELH